MALPLPTSLSPSKVSSFKDCALAFRFSAIDRVPEPPTIWAAKGTLVHRALELLYLEEPRDRTVAAALAALDRAVPEILGGSEYEALVMTTEERAAFLVDAERLVRNAFVLEDPRTIRPIGLELRMEARIGSLRLRGIIDRLELDEDGELIVTDYKTGKVPGPNQEQSRLGGVQFYAFLCEQMLGRKPARVQLQYLGQPVAIISEPTDQSLRGLTMRASAIWTAVERACARDDFRPKPSRLCDYCSYKAWCPAFGGDPSQAPSRRFEHLPEDTELVAEVLDGALVGAAGGARAPVSGGRLDLTAASEDVLLDATP
jgi:putative RecB family exonuclease